MRTAQAGPVPAFAHSLHPLIEQRGRAPGLGPRCLPASAIAELLGRLPA